MKRPPFPPFSLFIFLCIGCSVTHHPVSTIDYCTLRLRHMTVREESLYWRTAHCAGLVARPPLVVEVGQRPCPNDSRETCLLGEADEVCESGEGLCSIRGKYMEACRAIVIPEGTREAVPHESLHHLLFVHGMLEESESHDPQFFGVCAP